MKNQIRIDYKREKWQTKNWSDYFQEMWKSELVEKSKLDRLLEGTVKSQNWNDDLVEKCKTKNWGDYLKKNEKLDWDQLVMGKVKNQK